MALGSPQWMYSSGEYELEQGLKFEDSRSTYLSRTPAADGNRKTWTLSYWIKRGGVADHKSHFGGSVSASETVGVQIQFDGNIQQLIITDYRGGYQVDWNAKSTGGFRDTSAWYHIVIAIDTTQGTASDRVKLYANGELLTLSTYNAPSQNFDTKFNQNSIQVIGASTDNLTPTNFYEGYMSEVNFLDGVVATPSDFGETGDYGEWKPKKYSGTYGTNGFYLPFKQDYTVEGFSTVTYKGNSADRYLGGFGFKPGFVWQKTRDYGYGHQIVDAVRGSENEFYEISNAISGKEATTTNGLTGFKTDGVTLGTGNGWNNSARTQVMWAWDMGSDTPTGFGCVTWTGNAVDNREISGVGFQPDLVWLKSRSDVDHHYIQDSVRGAQKQLTVNDTTAESSYTNGVKSFTPDGFTLGTSNWAGENAQTRVAWCWDMGGSNASNTTGGINSTVRANTTYGQSIVSFTGTGSSATVGHGLNSAPEVVIVMNRDIVHNPSMWHTSIPNTHYLHLDNTAASAQNTAYWSSTSPTNQVFTVGTSADVNGSSNNMIAYCFHSVSGYSKFGTYNGTGSANNAVTLGFRPAFLMVKRINSTEDWFIFDSTRNPLNTVNLRLKANTTDADGAYSYVNFTDTGFSWQATGTGQNGSGDSYIYMAFAGGMDSISDYNDTGSIDSRVKANPTYGQSVVSYIGNNTAGATVGHGLSSAPEMMIVKNRELNSDWIVYHSALGNTKHLRMNLTDGEYTSTLRWNDTSPTSSVFTLGSDSSVSENNDKCIAYCFHSVTGYSKIGSYTGNASTNALTFGFKPAFMMIKKSSASGNSWIILDTLRDTFGKYLEANNSNVEGSASYGNVTDTGFTMTNSFGATNASGATYIYMAFADKREYAYWLDQSGNNNDWTSNNLTESDISVDSPSNNFATWNSLFANGTLSEGNLKMSVTDNRGVLATMAMTTGKWYWEILPTGGTNWHIGIGTSAYDHLTQSYSAAQSVSLYVDGRYYKNGVNIGTATSYTIGDIIGLAFDADTRVLKYYKNNTLILTYTADAINSSSLGYFPGLSAGGTPVSVANFGQDSSFAGNKTAQGNQDGNDIGDFYYTPPTGFLALCTKNLPDVDVVPSEHFNTVLWTGNGSTQSISNLGFQPDFVWIKQRSNADSNVVFDAVRGVHKRLVTDATAAEADWTSVDKGLDVFSSDGFTVKDDSSGNYSVNKNSGTFVAWNWKANGSGSSNTDGSITSTVSANVDAGFSIVSWTGNEGSDDTIGHGLSKAPEMIIAKVRGEGWSWAVFHEDVGKNKKLLLNSTDAESTDTDVWADTLPTSNVFTVGTDILTNWDGRNYIGYCFHSVDGYSKVGQYNGNGNADGKFVYTGFKPAFVMVKNTTNVGEGWLIVNNKTDPINPTGTYLSANSSFQEQGTSGTTFSRSFDFTANGFKLRGNSTEVNENTPIIYIAFAETPFKYSNAR